MFKKKWKGVSYFNMNLTKSDYEKEQAEKLF